MKTLKQVMRLAVMLGVCVLMVACPEPSGNLGGVGNEFEVAVGFPQGMRATNRSTINDDLYVEKVYVKVYNSSDVHLPAVDETSDISGVTQLSKNEDNWSATVKLAAPVSGTITFEVWAVTSWGMTLYTGETSHTVGATNNSIVIATQAVSAIGSVGPAGGLIFYDKGYNSYGWRFLEAAPAGWYGTENDPTYVYGKYIHEQFGTFPELVGTNTEIGTGEANTNSLTELMGNNAYSNTYVTTASYAAKICADHIGGGYDDWFLPSKNELSRMYQRLAAMELGDFTAYKYWSSSEASARDAWYEYFNDTGGPSSTSKYDLNGVRPARAF